MRHLIAVLCLLACSLAHAAGRQERLASPDGNIVFTLQQKTDAAGKRALYYSVQHGDDTVMRESLLELRLDNHLSESAMALPVDRRPRWFDNLNVTGVRRSSHDSRWKPVTGEAAQIRDHYQAMTVELVKDDNPVYKLALEAVSYTHLTLPTIYSV